MPAKRKKHSAPPAHAEHDPATGYYTTATHSYLLRPTKGWICRRHSAPAPTKPLNIVAQLFKQLGQKRGFGL